MEAKNHLYSIVDVVVQVVLYVIRTVKWFPLLVITHMPSMCGTVCL